MRRTIEEKLVAWKDSKRRKPLILKGARQVGKTWTISEFGKNHFEDIVIVDLEKNRDMHAYFAGNLNPKTILQSLEIVFRRKIIPGKVLLFFDEIQSCPRAIMALRYFYEEIPQLHVIAAGSLLEFALKDISFPVGRIQYLHLYPMTFYEFLLATGNDSAVEIISSQPEAFSETVHEALLSQLKPYFLTGGMPESVKVFVEDGTLFNSFEVHQELILSFKDDFSKYAPYADKHCLDNVFKSIATNIGNQIKYSSLSDSFSQPTNKKAFDLLNKALVIQKICSIGNMDIPFDIHSSDKKFKSILVDIGLLQHLSGISTDILYKESNLMNMYRGALAEQFVGQEFIAAFEDRLFYWARDYRGSGAEVDFAVKINGKPYPVEVKSGKAGSLKSLHMVLKSNPQCAAGIIFSTRPFSTLPEQKLIFLPLYYAGNLKNIDF